MDFSENVDAIEDGKIVRVSREYARKEGLFILRDRREPVKEKEEKVLNVPSARENKRVFGKSPLDLDKLRKPLDYLKNDVVSELIDNFHWEVLRVRKLKGLTRKQLAFNLGISEEQMKMIENGLLPRNDFVLVAKLENFLGITLRKSVLDYQKKMKEDVERREVGESKDIDVAEV